MLFAALILAQTYVAIVDFRSHDLALEEKMAIINAGHPVEADDVIARFRFLLTSLEKGTGVDCEGRRHDRHGPRHAQEGVRQAGRPPGPDRGRLPCAGLSSSSSLAEIVALTVITMGTR